MPPEFVFAVHGHANQLRLQGVENRHVDRDIRGHPLLLRKPFIGEAANLKGYTEAPARAHLFGWFAGAIWCIGTFSNFISARLAGGAISWDIGSGAPMVGALWGILLWKEFDGASRRAWLLIATSLALYTAGVVLVAIAYQRR